MLTKTLVLAALLAQAPATPPAAEPPADAPVATPAPVPTPSLSQPSASELPTLSFEEALVQAEKQNPDLDVARARLRQAQTLGAQAWSGYLPQVQAQGGLTHNSTEATLSQPTRFIVRDTGAPTGPEFDPSRPAGPTNPSGAPTNLEAVGVDPFEIPIQKRNQLAGQISARQGILVPELFPAIKNAYLAEKVSELTTENVRRELLFGVARAYLGAASLRESIAVQEQLLEVRRGFEKDAQARFSVGDVAKIAVLRATLDRTRAEQDLVRSRNAYQAAKSSLAALLARPVDFDVALPSGSGVALPEQAADPAQAQKAALDARPDLEASRTGVELAFGQRRRVTARYLPSLVATGNFLASNSAGFTGASTSWNVGLGVSWNIFDGGLREAQLREANGRIAEAKATQRATEERVKDEVRRARLDLESAEANQVKADEQVKLARESAQLVKNNFEAGVATYLEVTDANTALSGAELSAVNESLNVRLARLALVRAMGLFDPTRGDIRNR